MFNVIQAKAQVSVCPHCQAKNLKTKKKGDLSPKNAMITLHCDSCHQEFILFNEITLKNSVRFNRER